ncbi:MAG: FHA domain-containing protein [Oscillospiraceae bacterium]|jgi:hypothetical protein|nr:FHA domain-containing protein [Oscillospiraceae bacterium]
METFLLALNRIALPLIGVILALVSLLWLARHKGTGPPEAWLLNPVNHDRLPLLHWENSIGRHQRCDVVLGYGTVSRHHAVIARRKNGWVLTDTGSRGGTLRNGVAVAGSEALENGDSIIFGAFECMFCDREEALQQTQREAELFRRQRDAQTTEGGE